MRLSLSFVALGLCLAACSALPAPQTGGEITDFTYMRWAFESGQRLYDRGDWGDLDELPAIGVTGTNEPPDWLLGLDGGIFWTGGDGDLGPAPDIDLDAWEGFAGVMKSVELFHRRLVLELGAGYSLTYAYADDDQDLSTWASDDAWWSAVYGRAELLLHLGDDVWVGLSGRSTRGGSASLLGADLDGDYDQIAFVLAARW